MYQITMRHRVIIMWLDTKTGNNSLLLSRGGSNLYFINTFINFINIKSLLFLLK